MDIIQQPACLMCSFRPRTESRNEIIEHMAKYHRFDNNFRIKCTYDGCGVVYNRWISFKSHVHRKHSNQPPNIGDNQLEDNFGAVNIVPNVNNNVEEIVPLMLTEEEMKRSGAKFLLHARDSLVMSQSAILNVIEGVTDLVERRYNILKRKLVNEIGLDHPVVNTINKIFDGASANMFDGIHTQYLLDQYVINHANMINPVSVTLGTEWLWANKPTLQLVEKIHHCHIVPFKQSLEQLLNNDDVLHCVDNPRIGINNDFIRDFRDGQYMNKHEIFGIDDKSLQILVYYDDVELVNPLGSKTKIHKVAIFYWLLGNVYPELRSSLKAVNLLAIVKSTDMRKYGVDHVLKSFLDDIKLLERAEGLSFNLKGRPRLFRGTILIFSGDTLASNYMGGFKEGVSFANRPCRTCNVKRENLGSAFHEKDFLLRNKTSYNKQCLRIEEGGITQQTKDFWSKISGINVRSCLYALKYFDVTKCMPHDFMHVFVEGVLELEIIQFLKYCLDNNCFRLADLNKKISSFHYQHLIKDKPSLIEPSHLENKLRQTAAQMITLGYLLPFFVSDYLCDEDEHLQNYILLVQIMNFCLAYEIKTESIIVFEKMIEVHHLRFVGLYPLCSITPKFHYLVHVPNHIRNFGLPRHQWCMRFEAAHCYFTTLAGVMKNFRNITRSLSYRFQSRRCAELMIFPGESCRKFLYMGDVVKPGKTVKIGDCIHSHLIGQFLNEHLDTKILITPHISVHGTSYCNNSCVLLQCIDDDFPLFSKVQEIIVYHGSYYLIYRKYDTLYFERKLNAYRVSSTHEHGIINIAHLTHPHNLSVHNHNDYEFVILLSHCRIEFEG